MHAVVKIGLSGALVATAMVLAGPALADDETNVRTGLMKCAEIADAANRLGCFDRLARGIAPVDAPAAPLPGMSDEGLSERYAGSAPPSLQQRRAEVDAPREGFTRPISAISVNPLGKAVFTLGDGQVYRQIDNTDLRLSQLRAQTAVFVPGALGSWFLRLDGKGRKIRVTQDN